MPGERGTCQRRPPLAYLAAPRRTAPRRAASPPAWPGLVRPAPPRNGVPPARSVREGAGSAARGTGSNRHFSDPAPPPPRRRCHVTGRASQWGAPGGTADRPRGGGEGCGGQKRPAAPGPAPPRPSPRHSPAEALDGPARAAAGGGGGFRHRGRARDGESRQAERPPPPHRCRCRCRGRGRPDPQAAAAPSVPAFKRSEPLESGRRRVSERASKQLPPLQN